MRGRLEEWRRRLIDLSFRNRLIAYKPLKASSLHIAAPTLAELLADPGRSEPWDFYFPPEIEDEDGAEAEESDAAITVDEMLVRSEIRERGRKANEIEVTERDPKRIARILDNLAKRSNAEFQDKALRILYLAAGFLDWRDNQRKEPLTSPLVLVPVELQRASTRDPYRLYFVDDEEVVINPSLTEKLRRDAGLAVPEDWEWEDKPIGQELDEIRGAVADNGWTVRDDAALGLFSFQKYVMYRDLLDNEDRISRHPMIRSLAHGRLVEEVRDSDPDVPEPSALDAAQPPASTLSVLDSDASQRQCVEAAKRGRSFVMQGPPGTGKSQTIANIIAEALGQGKRVLFVSEKAAALDVVHKRLRETRLDEYCLMLHGEHAARREVVEALHRSLSSGLSARQGMSREETERLADLRTFLNESVTLLHLPQPTLGGHTLRDVYADLASDYEAPSIAGAPEPSSATESAVLGEFHGLNDIFQRLAERWSVTSESFAWRDYTGRSFTSEDRGRVLALLQELTSATEVLRREGAGVASELAWKEPRSAADAQVLQTISEHLLAAPRLSHRWLDGSSRNLSDTVDEAKQALSQRAEHELAFQTSFPARNAGDFSTTCAAELRDAEDHAKRSFGWTQAWDQELSALQRALAALKQVPMGAGSLQKLAGEAAQALGQPVVDFSRERVEELAELAELSFKAEHRPEADWLVRAGLERADQTIDAVAGDLIQYQENWAALAPTYDIASLDLGVTAIRERFAEQYTSVFSKLSSAYRQDAKAIKAVRLDGKLPGDLVEDLALIAATREVGERIDAQHEKIDRAFGSYASGRETDPAAVRAALHVAKRAMELNATDVDLAVLAERLCSGSEPEPEVARLADRLRSGLAELDGDLAAVQTFVGSPNPMWSNGLPQLQAQVEAITPDLERLADRVADLNTGAIRPANTFQEVTQRAQLVTQLHRSRSEVASGRARWTDLIGEGYRDDETDWKAVRAGADWLVTWSELSDGAPLPEPVRPFLLGERRNPLDLSRLAVANERIVAAIDGLAGLFGDSRRTELASELRTMSFAQVLDLRREFVACVDELPDWTELQMWRERARSRDWDEFIEQLIVAATPARDVVPAFRRAYWNRRLEAFYAEDPDFADDLRGGAFQSWVDEFCQLDVKLVRSGPDRLIKQQEDRHTAHVASPGSEVELLRREHNKKRRHLPVRRLLARLPLLLSELKPCLMMSPLTVSHFLSPDHTFDLVVFDEASQVPPQDAINCIYRGDAVIVAGDNRQLPPTPFFRVAELDDTELDTDLVDAKEDMESILDSCDALLPSHSLRWHYRSRSEALISFSNKRIYDDELITFPAVDQDTTRLGVSYRFVPDGIYDRGRSATNRPEAKVAAQRAADYLMDGTGRSVGVIAFNSPQAQAIAEELDLLKIRHPELEPHFRGDRLDAVFVKHLEAVQGDERDVILFSIGYGPDATGAFSMNFGPVNRDGGQRRLNVAITRAKQKVEVIASVRSSDFRLADESKPGPRMLRDYIAYAEGGGRGDASQAGSGGDALEPLEEQVARAVRDLDYEPVANVGMGSFKIDIGVRHPVDANRFVLGIECDGRTYAQTPTARDRERLRHQVLTELGWSIHRIWSLDWVRNRNAEVERLRSALEHAEISDRTSSGDGTLSEGPRLAEAQADRVERVVHELNDEEAVAALPWTTPYVSAVLVRQNSYYEFHESVNRQAQAELVVEIAEAEAPISASRVVRRLAAAWGLRRAGHRVVAASHQAIRMAERQGQVEVRDDFVWLPGQEMDQVRVPDADEPESRREIDDLPAQEIDLAIQKLREASPGVDGDALIAQVARIFGYRHTGGRIRNRIAERLEAGAGF